MKSLNLLIVLLIAATLPTFAQNSEIDTDQSVVKWTGNKVLGSHHGEIQIKSGYFEIKDDKILGGKVVMDMNSITDADLEDPGYNQKLVGHLKSDDFFGVEKFPTSTFEMRKAEKFTNGKAVVSGDLTIKGKTEPVSFEVLRDGNTYSTRLEVDRSKYDVRYGSNSFFDNLGDKAIDDIFILDIKLVLK